MTIQQFLRMENKTHTWKGDWPPPDRLVTAVIDGTDITILMDPTDPWFGEQVLADDIFEVTYWVRNKDKTSRLTEDDAPAHMARGAQYEREEQPCDPDR